MGGVDAWVVGWGGQSVGGCVLVLGVCGSICVGNTESAESLGMGNVPVEGFERLGSGKEVF